jgi:hypothetical protein
MLTLSAAAAVLLLGACTTTSPPATGTGSAEQVRARVLRLLPLQTADREAWARDITVAFTAQDIAATTDNVCAVLAVAEQESSFQADPAVPGLPAIARREIDRRAQALHLPGFVINAALDIDSPTGKTYKQRLDTVRTEKQLSDIFEDFIGMVPMGRTLFSGLNPVHTGGPMQVSVAFAQEHAKDYPYPVQGSIRKEVFSRRGGVYFGVAHLLGYPAHYDAMLYRFADFNAGWYASRNAAFQNAVSRASGISLSLDGDVVRYGSDQPGQTELAVRALRRRLGLSDDAIHLALSKGETLDFEDTALYRKVYALADGDAGRPLPRAMLPGITLESPKITRTLTTAWFANRVQERWKRCMSRAGA